MNEYIETIYKYLSKISQRQVKCCSLATALHGLIPFPNRSWREDKPQTVQLARQGEVDKVTDDLEME